MNEATPTSIPPDAAITSLVEPPAFDLNLMSPNGVSNVPDPAPADDGRDGDAEQTRPTEREEEPTATPASEDLSADQRRQLSDLYALMNDPDRLDEAIRLLQDAREGHLSQAQTEIPLPSDIAEWTDETADAIRWTHQTVSQMKAEIAQLRQELSSVKPVVGDIRAARDAEALSSKIGRKVSAQDLRSAMDATGINDPGMAYRAWAYDRDVKSRPAPEPIRKPVVPQSAPNELDLSDPKLDLADILAATKHMFDR